jgi:serine/threonine-protein kinase
LVVGLAATPSAAAAPPEQPQDDADKRRRRWWWAAGAAVLAVAALVAALELVSSPAEVTVPGLIGQSETLAVHKLKALGLNPTVSQSPSVTQAAGTVLSQNPPVGTVAKKGTRVFLTVSTGPGNVAVPNVVGKSQTRALKLLHERGLPPAVQSQPSRNVNAGVVISTSPSAGTVVLQGSRVTVSVSSGEAGGANPTLIHVPDVKGSSLHVAEEELATAGLTVGTVTRRGSASQPETVISQLPVAGASLAPGGAVNLVIAEPQRAAREVVVPNVVGKSETAAAAALGAAGLNPTSLTRSVTSASENGIVLEETPEAGQLLKRGTTITIVVGALAQQSTTVTTAATTEAPGAVHP